MAEGSDSSGTGSDLDLSGPPPSGATVLEHTAADGMKQCSVSLQKFVRFAHEIEMEWGYGDHNVKLEAVPLGGSEAAEILRLEEPEEGDEDQDPIPQTRVGATVAEVLVDFLPGLRNLGLGDIGPAQVTRLGMRQVVERLRQEGQLTEYLEDSARMIGEMADLYAGGLFGALMPDAGAPVLEVSHDERDGCGSFYCRFRTADYAFRFEYESS